MVLVASGSSFAGTYNCPSKIKMDTLNGASANMKTGRYSTDDIMLQSDARLSKVNDWSSQVTLEQPKYWGSCAVNTHVVLAEGVSSLVCECTDNTNHVTFRVAKSVIGEKCTPNGKLGFVCTP